jgi:cupin superfamily acireductone dioxygenase involved in methionine salvage
VPVIYTIDAKEKLIRTRCIGNVTLAEVVAHFRELEADPNSAAPLDVLLDLSETGSLPDTGQIAAVAEEISRIQARVRFKACAVVAQRDALFGMLRMFEVRAEPHFHAIRVFRAFDEAEAWLHSQRFG